MVGDFEDTSFFRQESSIYRGGGKETLLQFLHILHLKNSNAQRHHWIKVNQLFSTTSPTWHSTYWCTTWLNFTSNRQGSVWPSFQYARQPSNTDFCPTSLLKTCQAVFSIIITRLANLSFTDGQLPTKFTLVQVTPLIKKAGLYRDDPSNYMPISNLSNSSKMIERIFLHRIRTHVTSSPNFNPYQSAYRSNHSTESAIIITFDNIYHAIDLDKSTLLYPLISVPSSIPLITPFSLIVCKSLSA